MSAAVGGRVGVLTSFGVLGQARHVRDGVRHVRLVERAGEQRLGDARRSSRVNRHVLTAVRGPLPRYRCAVQPVVRLRVRRVHHRDKPMLRGMARSVPVQQRAVWQSIHVRRFHVHACVGETEKKKYFNWCRL